MSTDQSDRYGELQQGQEPSQQGGGDFSKDQVEYDLSALLAGAVESRKLDPERLGQEKQNIYETNVYYIYGGDGPITMARTISDSNIQSGTVQEAGRAIVPDMAVDPPASLEEVNKLLQRLYPSDAFFSFLTIIFLGTVKERSLHKLSGQLRNMWEKSFGACQPEETPSENKLCSQMDLLQETFSAISTYLMNTNAGEVQVQCIHPADQQLGTQWTRWFWDLFPNHRSVIVDWLFGIVEERDRFVSRCARDAIKRCAAFSFLDFQELILPRIVAAPKVDTVAWLADILRDMLKAPALSSNATMLLRHLTSLDNSILSLTGIYLLEEIDDPALERQAAGLLEKALLGKIQETQLKVSVLIASITAARHSEKGYTLLMEGLRLARTKATNRAEAAGLEDAYLHLSMGDYLTAGRVYPELLLLDLRTKTPREASLPVFLQCWRNPDTAHFLTNIWDAYFEEAARGGYSLEYTKIFWRRMAFQNSPTEFNRACFFLREAQRKHPKLANFFCSMREQMECQVYQTKKRAGI